MYVKATLCYIIKGNKVLLIKKKRGPGSGKWNGPGGKVEDDETALQAVVREVEEEIGVTPINPKIIGFNKFSFDDKPFMDVFIAVANDFKGQLIETDEAKPKWFSIDDIEYDNMWPDDIYWMPLMFNGKKFTGIFDFNKETNKINYHNLSVMI
tara:strand:- start:157 stop:615 length:459 start_codon:yes stop_codon:yes gene_type:complete